jgi:hypothetical protein
MYLDIKKINLACIEYLNGKMGQSSSDKITEYGYWMKTKENGRMISSFYK